MIYLNNIEKTIHKPAATSLDPIAPDRVKELAARLFNVKKPENIYLTAGGGQAMEAALRSYVEEGSCVITTDLEQGDTYKILEQLKAKVTCLESDAYFRPAYDKLEELIGEDTQAIVCAHGCSATGNVVDLERICAIARRHNIPVIADGRLTAGAVDINLEAMGADVFCFTGEKMLMGPEGIGGICLKDSMDSEKLEKVLAESADRKLCSDARQTGVFPNQLAINAFAASLEFILDRGIYGVTMLPHRLAKRFFESTKGMTPVTVHGDYGCGDRLPVVSITAKNFTAEEIKAYMREQSILIDTEKGMARFSFGYFNDRPQVKETVQRLLDMLEIDDPYLLP